MGVVVDDDYLACSDGGGDEDLTGVGVILVVDDVVVAVFGPKVGMGVWPSF